MSGKRTAWPRAKSTRMMFLAGVAALCLQSGPTAANTDIFAVSITTAPGRTGAMARQVNDLLPGQRIVSRLGTRLELAFSDGSTIRLEDGADFTYHGVTSSGNGRPTISGTSTRGRLMISTSADADVEIETAGRRVRTSSARSIIEAGPQGRVTLVQGRRVTVTTEDGSESILRRANFSIAFQDGATTRQSQEDLAAATAPFTPTRSGQSAATEPAPGAPDDDVDGLLRRTARGFILPDSNAGMNYANLVPPRQPGSNGPQLMPEAPPANPLVTSRVAPNIPLTLAGLSAADAAGSGFAAPGFNGAASSLDSAGDISGAAGDSRQIVGMVEQQALGTARVRRMTPSFSGARTSGDVRLDAGTISPPVAALAGGPQQGISSTYFQNVVTARVPALEGDARMAAYDMITNANIVTLQITSPNSLGHGSPTDPPTMDILPRISFTDSVEPRVTHYYGNLLYNASIGRFLLDSDGNPVRVSRYATSDQELGEILAANPGYQVLGNFLGFDQRSIVYTPGSVLEVGVRPGTASAPIQQELSGISQPFALAGGNGLAIFVGHTIPNVGTLTYPYFSDFLDYTIRYAGGAFDVDGTLGFSSESRRTQVNAYSPRVFIVDKVTDAGGGSDFFAARGIDPGERYFAIGGQPVAPGLGGTLPISGSSGGITPGTVIRFAISDGLNPLGPDGLPNINLPGGFRSDCAGGNAACSVAAQFLTPDPAFGRPIAFGQYNAFRPEESFIAGAPRGDTHLLVVSGERNRHPAMRFDLQIAADGRSSAGISTGGLLSLPGTSDTALALSGNTVGSFRPGAGGSVVVWGNFGSLATAANGYGAHVFENTDATDRGGGLIGHFAVGESDVRSAAPPNPAAPSAYLPPVQPGSMQTVGGAIEVPFGFTRLATNVGAVASPVPRGPLGGFTVPGNPASGGAGLTGFAAGLVEAPDGNGNINLYAGVGANLGDVRVVSHTGDRELSASIRVSPRAVGEVSAEAPAAPPPPGRVDRVLNLGGDTPAGVPTTAMVSASTFAAVIPRQAGMASADLDTVAGIRRPDGTPGAMPPSNEHVAWGVFLGDLVANASGGQREFAGMSFWVAGRPVDYGALQSLTGTATYQGGMVGNVLSTTGLRTVAGEFAHQYDFGRRAGTFTAAFDGANYTAGTGMNGTNVFNGSGPGAGAAGDRTLSVRGAFFHNPETAGPVSPANLPVASGGVFGISGPQYGANGIFVGSRR